MKKKSPSIQVPDFLKPPDPGLKGWANFKQLKGMLPLLHGNLTTEDHLKTCLRINVHMSKKISNKITYYKTNELVNSLSWRWPAETLAMEIAASLKPPLNEVMREIKALLLVWQGILKERRTCGLQASGAMTTAVFSENYGEKLAVIKNAPWNSVKGMLPKGFDYRKLVP